jgi:hypothetical protein
MKLILAIVLFGACSAVALAEDPPVAPSNTLTIDGETFEEVKFINASASKIIFRHKRGIASFPMEKFPADVQRRFGYNPQRAEEERAAEEARLREQTERAAAAIEAQAEAQRRLDEEAKRRIEGERADINRAAAEARQREEDARRAQEARDRELRRREAWGLIINPNANPRIDPNLRKHQDAKFNYMQSAIYSGSVQRVQQLLSRDPTYISCRGDEGQTPLHYAASLGYDQICGVLLDAKADPNARCNKGRTTVRWARDAGKNSTAEYLRKRGGNEF